jgi:hypothetical protein
MLSEIFLSFAVTTGVGAVLVVCRLLYKSKCKNFELCCLKVQRDAEQENNADLVIDLARRFSNSDIKPPIPEQMVRYENVYKNDLSKKHILDNRKSQVVSVSPSDIESTGEILSNIPVLST